ncbi:amidohydrolase [Falsigemmobacter faecalis]|uniref:Amidohydrolase n=1 Tax=Falsigemmobacter faecalis TaxID=2488730 RepID=A0A3P3DQP1_9RHOB|nr:amidohydrolase [Falsigemmobacter faecalis]RRH76587.1 amidohydrolase [Falsigemmobacter faecalis]
MLSNSDIHELTEFRHHLHRHPEVSGEEAWTAEEIRKAMSALNPSQLLTGLGGHGVAAVFEGAEPGPTVLFRCELDALPIEELTGADFASEIPGKGHQCGHDGHMAILTGLGRLISRRPPAKGRIVLMYQPAEEDGSGAALVIADPAFAAIRPDWAFSLHNFPGTPLGTFAIEAGDANCASRGLKVVLTGHTSHASTPEFALSPALSLARLIPRVMEMGPGSNHLDGDFRLVTVTHAKMGEEAFGITPGRAELWMTLRCVRDEAMEDLLQAVIAAVEAEASATGLSAEFSHHDVFNACTNDPEATARIIAAAETAGVVRCDGQFPMRGSEDFGLFGSRAGAKSAMFRLGSGYETANLHNPDYMFPDAVIEPGVRLFHQVARDLLG